MGASVSYKLKSSLQGALAAGGDPATSPLYVFGPFLVLITSAGVASITFGASIWMAVVTVVAVALMYRYVMIWVTDGSGDSGLCEEEFGSWAVKVNAAITVIEYTLTFLVSIAALVTFTADRISFISSDFGFISVRSLIAVVLSFFIALIVNRGPKVSSAFFGPATAFILGFLWLLIGFTIYERDSGYDTGGGGQQKLNTGILQGFSGGGGYSVSGVGVSNEGGYSNPTGQGGGAKPGEKPFDLGQFLPKNPPQRNLAGLAQSGKGSILANKHDDIFQRVSNKYREFCIRKELWCNKDVP